MPAFDVNEREKHLKSSDESKPTDVFIIDYAKNDPPRRDSALTAFSNPSTPLQ